MNKAQNLDADIIIVGGGHAGLTQALLLAQNDFKVICVDRDDYSKVNYQDVDGRTTAISYGSHLVMKQAGAWDDLLPQACPIKSIDILDGQSPTLLNFSSKEMESEINTDHDVFFGWIINNNVIHQTLQTSLNNHPLATHLSGITVANYIRHNDYMEVVLDDGRKLYTKLVIGADGRQSFTREWMKVGAKEWSYDQQAIVTIVTHENEHNNIAVEHFKSEGPLAILPMLSGKQGENRSALVWTQHGKNAKNMLTCDKHTFITALNSLFPDFYGDITNIEKRFSYPLNFVHAYDYIVPRMVLIADAAHGIHPIAGQGLNLGLRDVKALNDVLSAAQKQNEDIGSLKILKKYQATRRPDNMAMAIATDVLNKLFSNNILPIKIARKIGLKLVSKINPAKRFFMRQAMGSERR